MSEILDRAEREWNENRTWTTYWDANLAELIAYARKLELDLMGAEDRAVHGDMAFAEHEQLRAERDALGAQVHRVHVLARDLQGDLREWYSHEYDELEEPPPECGGAISTRDLLDEADRDLADTEAAALAYRSKIRAEAFEEAAQVCARFVDSEHEQDAIRALAEKERQP